MKQIIAKSRNAAIKFAEGGRKDSQRAAYWKSAGKAYRAERIPGGQVVVGDADGLWWSATITVRQKLGMEK